MAGGAVLGSLVDRPAGDVDIFLIGDPSQGEQKLRELFHLIQQVQRAEHGANSRMLVTRSSATVTIFRAASPKAEVNPPPVQLVLHTAESLTNCSRGSTGTAVVLPGLVAVC